MVAVVYTIYVLKHNYVFNRRKSFYAKRGKLLEPTLTHRVFYVVFQFIFLKQRTKEIGIYALVLELANAKTVLSLL